MKAVGIIAGLLLIYCFPHLCHAQANNCQLSSLINYWGNITTQYIYLHGEINQIFETVVDYEALRRDNPQALQSALDCLRNIDISSVQQANTQGFPAGNFSLLINAYNMLAVNMVVRNPCKILFGKFCWTIRSIRDVSGWFTSVWNIPAGFINGQQYSLNDVENELVELGLQYGGSSYVFGTLHACIVCASASCPNIKVLPYGSSAPNLFQQMNNSMSDFLAHAKKGLDCQTDASCPGSNCICYMSSIFKWDASSFGAQNSDGSLNNKALLTWISSYVEENTKTWILANLQNIDVQFFAYDWELNDKAHSGPPLSYH